MAATYGPLALTANTITSVGIPATSDRVYIGNDSSNDLLVSFAVSQPANVATSNGDWPYVVQAMHHATLDIPDQYMAATALGPGGFLGKVWVLPIPRASSLALNGTISSLAQLWVTALDPGDASPDAYAAPRVTDLSSQARVISVPIVPSQTSTGNCSSAVGASTRLGPQIIGLNNLSNFDTFVIAYLYFFSAQPSSATLWGSWSLSFVVLDSNQNPFSSTEVHQFTLIGNVGTSPQPADHGFFPTCPMWVKCPANNTCSIQLQAKLSSSPGSANTAMHYTVGWGVDQTNAIPVPDIGGGGNPYLTGIVF